MRHALVVASCFLLGCSEDSTALTLTPATGPASGYYRVSFGGAPRPPEPVHVGPHLGYDLRDEPSGWSLVVQGGEPGSAPVGYAGNPDPQASFTYTPARDPRFARMVAIGASLTQGVQNGVPTQHGTLMSPAAQLARQLEGYFPLPLPITPFLAEISVADIGPPPACAPPSVVGHVTASIAEILPVIADGLAVARVDPNLLPHNVAVGGSRIGQVVHGPGDDLAIGFVTRLVYDPYDTGDYASQLELCESLAPTLIISTDLYGNDVAAAVLSGDDIDIERNTPFESFAADLAELLPRLAATEAEVFLANMPRLSVLPLTYEKRAEQIAAAVAAAPPDQAEQAASDAAAAADAEIAAIDQQVADMNALLVDEAAAFGNVHVVDLAGRIDAIGASGIDVADQHLTTAKLGGLLSFDGVHFTDTGYALVANTFISAINEQLGTDVPAIDLADVIANDAGSPAAIAAAGLDVSACTDPKPAR